MAYCACRLLLVDAESIVRRGLRTLFESQPDMVVAGEASGRQDALEQIRRCKPDVVILEPRMTGINGIDMIRTIHRVGRGLEILIFTACSSPGAARAALDAGSRGFVLKSEEPLEIIHGVRNVWEHKPYLTPQLVRADHLPREQFSERELTVMKLLASGFNNRRIASVLGIPLRSVDGDRERMMRKLMCRSFSGLIRFALRREKVESFDPGAVSLLQAAAPGFSRSAYSDSARRVRKRYFCPNSVLESIRIDRNEFRRTAPMNLSPEAVRELGLVPKRTGS